MLSIEYDVLNVFAQLTICSFRFTGHADDEYIDMMMYRDHYVARKVHCQAMLVTNVFLSSYFFIRRTTYRDLAGWSK